MTCIVGIASEGIVYIGGDRGLSDSDSILSMPRPKVVQNGEYLIGLSGSLGVGQLLQMIDLPSAGRNPEMTLRTSFTKSFKESLEEYGPDITKEDNDTDFLIGVKGKLYEYSIGDWSVAEVEYSAVGSGSSIALGSLYTSNNYKDPYKRIKIALEAACTLSPSCQLPIDIYKI